ncbi:hypothetical protein LTR97_007406 [Elasticomyces elasticus]|uniref:Uncharacterized protein n=1 Tax=Elasticomyces elasticus TaxID=574655 RepID=A0AAN7W6B7_9PEZI|nr:hypothetical protein LTR42_006869 [Elasticomyces elasticus]KAK5697270.1 hypothetical protein LTR97_007406 [Elasticomyces elasticus]
MQTLRKVRNSISHHEPKRDAVEKDMDAEGHALPEITDNIAFNSGARSAEDPGQSNHTSVKDKLKLVKHAVAHPHQAAKARGQKEAVKFMAQTERPWLTDRNVDDGELFEAYDDLEREREVNDKERLVPIHDAKDRVDDIEEKRTELEVVWHMSRYVKRARVVRQPLAWPPKERYRQYGPGGKYEGFLWVKWAGHWGYLFYSFLTNRHGLHSRFWMRQSDERAKETAETAATISELITRHGPDAWFEPFLDIFGPWIQAQVLDLAQFLEICNASYMWRNPSSTAYTCFGYFSLFLLSAFTSLQYSMKVFWMSAGMFFFLSRPIASCYPRFRHVVDPLRWFYWYQPTNSEHAFQWLREYAQVSLHRPQADAAHLGDFAAVLDDDNEEEEQLYFESLSSPTPQYHSLAAEQTATMSSEPAVLSFKAHWSGRRGRLEITRKSVRFVVTGRQKNKTEWERTLADLLEVRKLNLPLTDLPGVPSLTKLSSTSSALSILWVPKDDLRLASTEEHTNDETSYIEETMYGMVADRRDEAFNSIIGISGAMWMELQSPSDWQARTTKGVKSS